MTTIGTSLVITGEVTSKEDITVHGQIKGQVSMTEGSLMGAWEFVRPLLEELIGDRCPLRYIGRARSSSPSEGSAAWHQLNQKVLIEQAFDPGVRASDPSMVLSKQVKSLAGSKP